jgi:hypothetical protein
LDGHTELIQPKIQKKDDFWSLERTTWKLACKQGKSEGKNVSELN